MFFHQYMKFAFCDWLLKINLFMNLNYCNRQIGSVVNHKLSVWSVPEAEPQIAPSELCAGSNDNLWCSATFHYHCTIAGGETWFQWEIHIVIIFVIMEQKRALLVTYTS